MKCRQTAARNRAFRVAKLRPTAASMQTCGNSSVEYSIKKNATKQDRELAFIEVTTLTIALSQRARCSRCDTGVHWRRPTHSVNSKHKCGHCVKQCVHCEKRIPERELKAYWKPPLSRTARPLGSEPFRTESGREVLLDGNRFHRVLDKKGRSYYY